MRKIILFLLTFFIISVNCAFADSISKTLSALGINKSAVAISVKDVKTGNNVYSLNENAPMVPASTLKLVTSSAVYDLLGGDYKYKTTLYKSTNNDLYLKLSGDPLLRTADLEQLILAARDKSIVPKTFYIDDTAFDNVEWGEGWQWDDDLNPLMPKFSIYNLDGNMLKIEVIPTFDKRPAKIAVKPFYPLTFVNLVTTDSTVPSSVSMKKNNEIVQNMLNLNGTVSKTHIISIPAANPKMNFSLRLEEIIRNKKFEYFAPLKAAKLPEKNVYVVDSIEHTLDSIMPSILKYSNNLMAETVFKTAGSVFTNSIGCDENSIKMLNSYFEKIGLGTDNIKIVDGSGVSKNNLITADFMTKFLIIKAGEDGFESFKNILPTPGEGTLKNRMLYFKDNLRAKTGTLSDSSAIAGYITTRKGKLYAFDIMVMDVKSSQADKKNVEEQILRNIYANY